MNATNTCEKRMKWWWLNFVPLYWKKKDRGKAPRRSVRVINRRKSLIVAHIHTSSVLSISCVLVISWQFPYLSCKRPMKMSLLVDRLILHGLSCPSSLALAAAVKSISICHLGFTLAKIVFLILIIRRITAPRFILCRFQHNVAHIRLGP